MPRRTALVRSSRRRQESVQGKTRTSPSLKTSSRFVLCISKDEDDVDLEVGKVYPTLPDAMARKAHSIRVVDESGEDYVYPADQFIPIRVPEAGRRALLRARG